MRFLKFLAALAALAVIYSKLRGGSDGETTVARGGRTVLPDLSEPILGYDGMDPDTLVDWLESAELDEPTLERVRAYEIGFQNRQRVLDVIDDLLG